MGKNDTNNLHPLLSAGVIIIVIIAAMSPLWLGGRVSTERAPVATTTEQDANDRSLREAQEGMTWSPQEIERAGLDE